MFYSVKLLNKKENQTVSLPKALHFSGDTVIAKRFGNGVLLLLQENPWQFMQEALQEFAPDFEMQRE